MLALMPNQPTRFYLAASAGEDDLLLDRLASLVEQIDEVPQSVIDGARAAFRPRNERGERGVVSQPRRGGAAIEPGLLGLAKLLGPTHQLDALTGRAAADVAAVAAGAGRCRAGDRPAGERHCRTPARRK